MNIRRNCVPKLNQKIMMEPREQSESMNNLENDQNLNTEPQTEAQEVVNEEVKVEENQEGNVEPQQQEGNEQQPEQNNEEQQQQ